MKLLLDFFAANPNATLVVYALFAVIVLGLTLYGLLRYDHFGSDE